MRSERSEAAAAYAGLAKYFDTPARGAWRDKLKADGSWIEEPAPGSSMYHITCAARRIDRDRRGRRIPRDEATTWRGGRNGEREGLTEAAIV